jgi:hypothetical protein
MLKNKQSGRIPEDTQWCKNNIAQLTAEQFFDRFQFKDKRSASRRYNDILNKHLIDEEEAPRLLREFSKYKNSNEYKEYWIEKQRENVRWKIRKDCVKYVQEVAEDEVRMLGVSSSRWQEQYQGQQKQQQQQQQEQHWILEDQVNITDLFNKFRSKAINMLDSDVNICLESHVQELVALNHILIIQPHQHSALMCSTFPAKVLDGLLHHQLTVNTNLSLEFTMEEFIMIVNEIMKIDREISNPLTSSIELLKMATAFSYEKQKVVLRITMM